jgi:predicted  nucleic acid-binding Zn-ribbon protein
MQDFKNNFITLINDISNEHDEIDRLKYKIKNALDSVEKIQKLIKDAEEEIKSRENKIKNYKSYLNLFI